ncbi:hypothetical protein MMC25_001549 [Agyrium rufum]|nr:hypothetical protein [Agyrium rufum]
MSTPIIDTTKHDVYPFISVDHDLKDVAKGRTVLITGAGAGIGKVLSKTFALAGAATLVISSRRKEPLEELKAALEQSIPGCEILAVPTDVTNEKSVEALFAHLAQSGKKIDILINNAGSARGDQTIEKSDLDVWWGDWETNIKGTFLVSRAYLKMIAGGPGRIINISSRASYAPLPSFSSYCGSKAALNRLTELLDMEGKAQGVRCIALMPGVILGTEMAGYVPEWLREQLAKRQTDKPELPAGACLYLTLPRADYLGGRYVDARFNLEELEGLKEKILEGDLLKQTMVLG